MLCKLEGYRWFVLMGGCIAIMNSYGLSVATGAMLGVFFEQEYNERQISYTVGNVNFAVACLMSEYIIMV